ncbi:hypothetical protein SADUNF_Sadunf14G0143200 [Salix dunnii]|uniref:Uncharacterized protein n=1 Tax=Salix dunnii TaxID=1413687 RepID=A0A835JFN1_9ROSI|nr:hypothetical protein SADUNF_Sadunf14G0143200 [Salix dunnii]
MSDPGIQQRVAGNRLLTDKLHRDVKLNVFMTGTLISSSQSDVARMFFGDKTEDKMIVSELRRSSSYKKVNGTPTKRLNARQMSKEVESKHNPPAWLPS